MKNSKQLSLKSRKNHYSMYIYFKWYKIMTFENYCSSFVKNNRS